MKRFFLIWILFFLPLPAYSGTCTDFYIQNLNVFGSYLMFDLVDEDGAEKCNPMILNLSSAQTSASDEFIFKAYEQQWRVAAAVSDASGYLVQIQVEGPFEDKRYKELVIFCITALSGMLAGFLIWFVLLKNL